MKTEVIKKNETAVKTAERLKRYYNLRHFRRNREVKVKEERKGEKALQVISLKQILYLQMISLQKA